MNLRPEAGLAREFAALVVNPLATELAVASLINRVIYPDEDLSGLTAALQTLLPPAGKAPWLHLGILGFQGDDRGLMDLDNSCVARVLLRRRGLPITLAILLIEVARRQGLDAWGLNAPGHFLACVDRQVIDPVQMMTLPMTATMQRASATDIALRMLNNLKHACLSQSHPHSALTVLDHQRAIAIAIGDLEMEGGLRLEIGNCWYALNLPELALEEYTACESGAAEGSQLARAASARIQLLKRMPKPTLH